MQVQDPSTWFPAGTNPRGYKMNADAALARCGKPGLHMQSLASATPDKFGTFMTQRPAEAFHGKRIELRATMKTVNVTGRAALWLRVDGPKGVLAFDNMQKRPITGSTELTSHSIVLDVVPEARELAFGVLLSDQGEVSVMGVEIRVVPTTVPTTAP